MGRLYKRGPTWWGDYRDPHNQRIRVSLQTGDREVARARLRDRELGTTSAAPHEAKALDTAIDQMVALKKPATAGAYRGYALHLCRLLGAATDIHALTAEGVVGYTSTRLDEGAARVTIAKELSVLRQALKEARRRHEFVGSLDIVPSWKHDSEPRTRWLTPAEFAKLFSALPPKRRTWVMIQTYTGAEMGVMKRYAALPRGGWEHVDLRRGTITLPGTKRNSRYRVDIPLHPELKAWLKRCDAGAPLVERWVKVNRDLGWTCARAGIPRVSTHDFRRTFGSWLVQAGVDLHHVARLMGNTPAMVARVYGQTSAASYAAAINTLPRMRRPRAKPRKETGP
jgi:integrase